MAKISKIFDNKPIPTTIDGIFIRDLPAKTIDDTFGDIEAKMKESPEDTIALFFTDLICDEKGDKFEDCQTFEGITSTLSVRAVHSIVQAVAEALQPGAETTKK